MAAFFASIGPMTEGALSYLTPEARARVEIDKMLERAGWVVQHAGQANLAAASGVAVREFVLAPPHGRVDYLLFVDRKAIGVIEAKKEGETLTGVEWQSAKYLDGVPDWVQSAVGGPLPFAYQSTGTETRFTNTRDPEARSRQVFWFHRPETLAGWIDELTEASGVTLRGRLQHLPSPSAEGLWPAQFTAIRSLEESFAANRPRALIQMATGAGKTFTAANVAYRLIKYAGARRVLFLVDRANLGRQTRKEFQAFTTPDDGRKFTELYNVQHLSTNVIDPVARVMITTIQRLYSILRASWNSIPSSTSIQPTICSRPSRCPSTTTPLFRSSPSTS
jgi:type I restriction enzyme, R subunit